MTAYDGKMCVDYVIPRWLFAGPWCRFHHVKPFRLELRCLSTVVSVPRPWGQGIAVCEFDDAGEEDCMQFLCHCIVYRGRVITNASVKFAFSET
jgi:hypothetical protein